MNITRRRWLASLPRFRPFQPAALLSKRLRLSLTLEGLLLWIVVWAAVYIL